LEEHVSNEQQHGQQSAQVSAPRRADDSRREFAQKGALAVLTGAASAIVRVGAEAVMHAVFGTDS
jgi:hypothetical protein